MADIERNEELVQQAVDGLISFFSEAENIIKLLKVFVEEVQEVENVGYDLWFESLLSTSEGAQLDQWGVIVGQSRLGFNDSDYRKAILTRILINLGEGEAMRLVRIISTLVDDAPVWYRQMDKAAYQVEWETYPFTADWIAYIKQTMLELTPAGVWFEAVQLPPTDAFRFDIGPGLDVGKLGSRVIP